MELSRPTAEVFVPDGAPPAAALARTTHLAIAAHADDVEMMALHGILACFGRPDRHFPPPSSPTAPARLGAAPTPRSRTPR
jgi:hypothetical protein